MVKSRSGPIRHALGQGKRRLQALLQSCTDINQEIEQLDSSTNVDKTKSLLIKLEQLIAKLETSVEGMREIEGKWQNLIENLAPEEVADEDVIYQHYVSAPDNHLVAIDEGREQLSLLRMSLGRLRAVIKSPQSADNETNENESIDISGLLLGEALPYLPESRKTGSQKSMWKVSFRDFSDRMTCHGLQDLCTAKSKAAIAFWSIIFGLCLVLLTFSVYQCIFQFYETPILTSYHTVPSEAMPIPDITICPTNFINHTKLKEIEIENPEKAKMIREMYHAVKVGNFEISGIVFVKSGIVPLEPLRRPSVKISDAYRNLTQQRNDIFDASLDPRKFIFFGNREYTVEPVLHLHGGVCYVVKVPDYNQTRPDLGISLSIDIHTEHDHQSNPNLVSTFGGIKVSFGNDPGETKRTLVQPGVIAILSLTKQEHHLITVTEFGKHTQQCIKEKKLSVINAPYTKSLCIINCRLEATKLVDKCMIPFNISLVREDALGMFDHFCQVYEMNRYYARGKACVDGCLRECDMITYDVSMSTLSFPSTKLINMVSEDKYTNYEIEPDGFDSRLVPCPELEYTDSNLPFNSSTCFEDCVNAASKVILDCFQHGLVYPIRRDELNETGYCNVSIIRNDGRNYYLYNLPESDPLYSKQFVFNVYECMKWCKETKYCSNASEIIAHIETITTERSGIDELNRQKSNWILLEIGFAELQTTQITQHRSMTVNTLLSNLGGTFGLWLGASLFTIIQLFVFLFKSCFHCVYKMKTRCKNPSKMFIKVPTDPILDEPQQRERLAYMHKPAVQADIEATEVHQRLLPPISAEERSLPRDTRLLLAQLRLGYSRLMNSFNAHIPSRLRRRRDKLLSEPVRTGVRRANSDGGTVPRSASLPTSSSCRF